MEPRKQTEIKYYDDRERGDVKEGDFEDFDPFLLKSYRFLCNSLKGKCQNKLVLDYGCGNGIHSVWLAQEGAKVIGIDLSQNSLDVARKRIERKGLEDVEFILMDCEKLDFPDNHFDIIFDGETFSSLDIDKALPELNRVLKPRGFLIGIETLGHNPIANLKRQFNKKTGRRTGWATEHIFKMKDFKKAENYFEKIDANFFHLVSWAVFPLLRIPGGKALLKLFEGLESVIIFILPFLKRYSFKTVFKFSNPKK